MSEAVCWRNLTGVGAAAIAVASLFCQPALADTLESALAYAYANNPQLNSQRALVRATDEGVPTALAGYRPRASITANAGMQSLSTTIREIGSTTALGAPASYFTQSGVNSPHGVGATVTQNLLNGFQTANRTRQAEAQVFAARETLRNIEQTVLLNAATAYMNLLRDAGILELQRSNLDVLQEQLRQTKQRLDSGNVTATDLSQAEARLNVGRTQLFAAEANYASSRAVYRQVIGLDPGRLAPAAPVDRFVPHTLPAAMAAGIAQNPVVTVAQFNVDVATHQVKVAEGALYPVLSLQGNVQKNYETTLTSLQSFTASAAAQYSVPLYQGGAEYAAIRQAKETQGQKQMDLSVARDQARVSVVQAWAQLEASKSSIESTRNQVKSAEAALNGTALAPEAETGFSHIFVIDRDGTEIRRRRYLRVLSIPLHPSPARVERANLRQQRRGRMFELQPSDRKPPPCPMCTHEMVLKTIHRQKPADHLIFKCGHCAIEYPVVAEKRD